MEKEEKISIEVDKPAFPIGQVVYVPIKNQIIETRIFETGKARTSLRKISFEDLILGE